MHPNKASAMITLGDKSKLLMFMFKLHDRFTDLGDPGTDVYILQSNQK